MISHNRKTGKLGFDILIDSGAFNLIYLLNRYSDKIVYPYTALAHITVEIYTPHFSYILILNFLESHKTAAIQGLTNLRIIEFPYYIYWMSPYWIKGLLGGKFHI